MDIQEENNLIQEAFEVEADEVGFCLDQKWGDYENPYESSDTALAFNLFKKGWQAAKAHEAEKLKGCVVVPFNNTTIVAIEKMVEQQVEASGITEDVFRLDGDRVIDALLQALGDDYVIVPVDQAKDTERLDFMLKENMVVSTDINWGENFERTGEGFCVNAVYWIDGWDRLTSTVHQTKREAIDAAMVEAARGGNE